MEDVLDVEMGGLPAKRLGYSPSDLDTPADLDRLPREAIDLAAGVVYRIDLADMQEGDHVRDLDGESDAIVFVSLGPRRSGLYLRNAIAPQVRN